MQTYYIFISVCVYVKSLLLNRTHLFLSCKKVLNCKFCHLCLLKIHIFVKITANTFKQIQHLFIYHFYFSDKISNENSRSLAFSFSSVTNDMPERFCHNFTKGDNFL